MPSLTSSSSILHKLSTPTPFFGIKLWILILIPTSLIISLFTLLLLIALSCSRPKKPRNGNPGASSPSMNPMPRLPRERPELGRCGSRTSGGLMDGDVESGGGCWRPRQRFTVEELEVATGGFACGNVISCGERSVVYRGVLLDRTRVVIKRLLCYSLAFLHEDTEPLVVHQNLSSRKILLDRHWNPKITDFGITKNHGSVWKNHNNVLAPQSACPENLDEKSDVYSFGILIMEIISGNAITFNTAFETEECLIDWIKIMVEHKKVEELVDAKLKETPSPVEMKRIILIALRCVDPDANDRPKMGEVIHMLEPRDLLLSDERVLKKQTSRRSSVKEEDILQAAASSRKN
ncbi:unnamed protein product [Cuscuta campestris]|uniref:non-specific serine/threonine protein kinase n=1 Tax=Cuscuta campestris TaxID=132261 RepID=A0A484L9F5_9ASTE|nr:unnamed protein product [Cuscuta campestris]